MIPAPPGWFLHYGAFEDAVAAFDDDGFPLISDGNKLVLDEGFNSRLRYRAPAIPAGPGWLVDRTNSDGETHTYRVIAWRVAASDDDPVYAITLQGVFSMDDTTVAVRHEGDPVETTA